MVTGSLGIRSIESLPPDIDQILMTCSDEGFDLVRRLVDDWESGCNCFDGHGEILLEARVDGRLVAVGGLNQDPYIDDSGVARIRHLYVIPEARGSGVGGAIVRALTDHARREFERVRLRAGPAGVGAFYLALGFRETDSEPDATHDLML